jgi:hypothetical protein
VVETHRPYQVNTNIPNPNDPHLTSLLRGSRVAPPLPPRFQENVWRRIADVEAGETANSGLDGLMAWLLRPQLAFAGLAALILLGAFLGMRDGSLLAKQNARARYIASVAPNTVP